MPMIESLPDRPLSRAELQAIWHAEDYDLVRPIEWDSEANSSGDSETAGVVVIVADDWFKVLNLCSNCGSWHLALKGERPPSLAPQSCHHLAASEFLRPPNSA